jgi:gentisate 1,2-dioxygenase
MTKAASGNHSVATLPDLYSVLQGLHCEPLWTMQGALTPEPSTTMVPHVWRYADLRGSIVSAGDLISAQDADRRVIAMRNPGADDDLIARATDTLWAAIQMVLPGEVAPPHRHTPAALRYIIEGAGGYTIIDGVRCEMDAGDFLVTPNWTWHEHGNDGDGTMIWLDGLDVPMLHALHSVFAQFTDPPSSAVTRPEPPVALGAGLVAARWDEQPRTTLVWKLRDVQAGFDALRSEPGSRYDDLLLEYRDPRSGGPVMRTMGAGMQLLRAGVRTETHRHTPSVVYHVVHGSGSSWIGDSVIEWGPGDTFAVPTWAPHRHHNPADEDAMLFSFTDEPALRSLGLVREEHVDKSRGH